jgi:hypothetical protein
MGETRNTFRFMIWKLLACDHFEDKEGYDRIILR